MPEPGAAVPITVRRPNPALGFTPEGEPRTEPVEKCRVTILGVGHGWLQEVTQQEAHLAGFRFRDDYIEAWIRRWNVPGRDQVPVWVLSFELDRVHRPRFLSQRVIAGTQGDYTSDPHRALEDAGEVPEDSYLERWADEAEQSQSDMLESRRRDQEQLPLKQQLAEYRKEARERHVDIRDELRMIERFHVRDPRVVEVQLEKIRTKLNGGRVAA